VFPLLLLIFLATMAIGLALFQVGRASVLRSTAQSAADAAALAGVRDLGDQLDEQIARLGRADLTLIDEGRLRAAASDYAARNEGRVVSFERLGADVRVRVSTAESLGETARPVNSEDERGEARARASMAITTLGDFTGAGATPGGEITGTTDFSDDGWDELEEELGPPPFSVEDVVTLGRFIQAHGLRVSGHPNFGGVSNVHARYPPNDHYSGGAIDLNHPAGDAAEAPVFDAIAPRLKAMGWHVLWRVPNHAPGDNSHMHIDKSPQAGQIGTDGGVVPVFGTGGAGDLLSEIRLVPWEGGSTTLAATAPGAGGNPFGPPDMEVVCTIVEVGERRRVSDRVMLSAMETAIVESGVHNLNYGDRDSLGVFQQRPSQGWGSPAQVTNVAYASKKYFETAEEMDRGQPAGVLAQDVQRSAFPERYAEREGQARELIARAADECGGDAS
jgi:hypothetical protein